MIKLRDGHEEADDSEQEGGEVLLAQEEKPEVIEAHDEEGARRSAWSARRPAGAL